MLSTEKALMLAANCLMWMSIITLGRMVAGLFG